MLHSNRKAIRASSPPSIKTWPTGVTRTRDMLNVVEE
jgi:hypothetical protein